MAKLIPVEGDFYAVTAFGVVLVGARFEILSRIEQEAVLAHEVGHIENHHTLKRWWWILSCQWRKLGERCKNQELEADAYAADAGFGPGLVKFLRRTKFPESAWHPAYYDRVLNIQRYLDGKR